MAKHYHAIPAALRGKTLGKSPIVLDTPHGKIEEGCFKRISTIFSDPEISLTELNLLKDELAEEYIAHIKMVEALIAENEAARAPVKSTGGIPLDVEFDKFLNGDVMALAAFVKTNPTALKQLRTYTNGRVEALKPGAVIIKRDNNQSRITILYSLSTKLKVGDHVFIRDDGAKPFPTAMAVWVNVKDAAIYADQLKQFF